VVLAKLASEFSENVQALALFIGAVTAPLAAYLIVKHFKTLKTEVRGVKLQLSNEVAEPIRQINRAVNHTPAGDLPLVKRLVRLELKVEEHIEKTDKYNAALAEKLGLKVDVDSK